MTSAASAGRNYILPEKCAHEVEQTRAGMAVLVQTQAPFLPCHLGKPCPRGKARKKLRQTPGEHSGLVNNVISGNEI